jgi:hypothetical protein
MEQAHLERWKRSHNGASTLISMKKGRFTNISTRSLVHRSTVTKLERQFSVTKSSNCDGDEKHRGFSRIIDPVGSGDAIDKNERCSDSPFSFSEEIRNECCDCQLKLKLASESEASKLAGSPFKRTVRRVRAQIPNVPRLVRQVLTGQT